MSETSVESAAKLAHKLLQDGVSSLRPHLHVRVPVLPLRPTHSDYDLNPEQRPSRPRQLSPAAVLMPIIPHADPSVLFTRRTEHLARHAGQVSFPGGRAHPDDADLVETALRETREEIGVAAEFVSVAGFLDPYETGTGYAILPVVGILREGFSLVPDVNEVAAVFEVPLAFFLDPANREYHAREWQGRRRDYYAFRYDGHYIWGATAAMLVGFSDRLSA